jgi:hypothetical protein
LRKKDKEETVLRIQKINEYKRAQIEKKIQADDLKTINVKAERAQLLEARGKMRMQAD